MTIGPSDQVQSAHITELWAALRWARESDDREIALAVLAELRAHRERFERDELVGEVLDVIPEGRRLKSGGE